MRYCWQTANVLTSRRQKNMRLTFHTLPTTSSSLSPRLSPCFCCSGLLVHCHHMYRLLLVRNPIHIHPVFPSSCSDSTSGSAAVTLFTVFCQLCCLSDHVKSVTLRSLSSVLFQFILGRPSFFLNSDEIHFNAWWTRCLGPNLCSLHVQPFDCFQHFLASSSSNVFICLWSYNLPTYSYDSSLPSMMCCLQLLLVVDCHVPRLCSIHCKHKYSYSLILCLCIMTEMFVFAEPAQSSGNRICFTKSESDISVIFAVTLDHTILDLFNFSVSVSFQNLLQFSTVYSTELVCRPITSQLRT